jgi:hypothetical protein
MKYAFSSAILFVTTCFTLAQDVRVNGNSSQTEVFKATNTSSAQTDRIGVQGTSIPAPYYGIGVSADGGFIGLRGRSQASGSGSRTGVRADASGGNFNYGLHASAGGVNSIAGYFSGNVYVTGTVTQGSDLALKKNVKPMGETLGKVMGLKPKSYEMNQTDYRAMNLPTGTKFGLIAQDVQAIFPELVSDVAHPNDDKSEPVKLKGVDYLGMVPVLLKAIQEQQTEIEGLRTELNSIRTGAK